MRVVVLLFSWKLNDYPMWQPNNNRAVNLVHNKEVIWNNYYSNYSALVFFKLEHIFEALLLQNGIRITLLLINGGQHVWWS